MARKKIKTIIKRKIRPFSLNEKDKTLIDQLERKYSYELILESIDAGVNQYFSYDESGQLTKESVETFLSMLGGILNNKSQTPIEQAIRHIKNKGKKIIHDWNAQKADEALHLYVEGLKALKYSEEQIEDELRGETFRLTTYAKDWSTWSRTIKDWLLDIKDLLEKDNTTFNQSGTILPEELFADLSLNIVSLCKQINASYENNLYDCTAVMMRRLLEVLLILSYQNFGVESEIIEAENHHYLKLDKIIKNAKNNSKLSLSAGTKSDMIIFKDLGNLSAHKIWYHCTRGDIKPNITKYRVIIEELLYKSGMRTKSSEQNEAL
ncbi:hypothetical protein IKS86_04105 [bacterium]|nr:hypothetical protein [bacterium]